MYIGQNHRPIFRTKVSSTRRRVRPQTHGWMMGIIIIDGHENLRAQPNVLLIPVILQIPGHTMKGYYSLVWLRSARSPRGYRVVRACISNRNPQTRSIIMRLAGLLGLRRRSSLDFTTRAKSDHTSRHLDSGNSERRARRMCCRLHGLPLAQAEDSEIYTALAGTNICT